MVKTAITGLTDFCARIVRAEVADEGAYAYVRVRVGKTKQRSKTAFSQVRATGRDAGDLEADMSGRLDALEPAPGHKIYIEALVSGHGEVVDSCWGQFPSMVTARAPEPPGGIDDVSQGAGYAVWAAMNALQSTNELLKDMTMEALDRRDATVAGLTAIQGKYYQLEAEQQATLYIAENMEESDHWARAMDMAESVIPSLVPILPLILATSSHKARKKAARKAAKKGKKKPDPMRMADECLAELVALCAAPKVRQHVMERVIPVVAQWQADAAAAQEGPTTEGT